MPVRVVWVVWVVRVVGVRLVGVVRVVGVRLVRVAQYDRVAAITHAWRVLSIAHHVDLHAAVVAEGFKSTATVRLAAVPVVEAPREAIRAYSTLIFTVPLSIQSW